MKIDDLIDLLSQYVDRPLAQDLVNEFIAIRTDVATGTLGRASVGKFVETVVQTLQYLDKGKYDKKPNVDSYLKNLESKKVNLNDDLKICCSRVARAAYTLRSKRSIAHKGDVDPNTYDLKFLYAITQWILSELVRQIIGGNMENAGKMIEFIQMPISSIVEDFGDKKIVYGKLTIPQEILVLLYSDYPAITPLKTIQKSLERRSKPAIYNALSKLWEDKLIYKSSKGYKLTQLGFQETVKILKTALANCFS